MVDVSLPIRQDQVLNFFVLSNGKYRRITCHFLTYHKQDEHRKATRACGATGCPTTHTTVEPEEHMARTTTVMHCRPTLLAFTLPPVRSNEPFGILSPARAYAPQRLCNCRFGREALAKDVTGYLGLLQGSS
ncbi:hypothetical protein M3J09_007087 [Ascochyta lentis]